MDRFVRLLISSIPICLVFLAVLLLSMGPVVGKSVCGGKDSLAELRTTQPDLLASAARRAAAIPNGSNLLWRIRPVGRQNISYILGTIHLADPRTSILSPTVKSLIEKVDQVLLEVREFGKEKALATQEAMVRNQQLLVIPGNGTLWQLTPPQQKPVIAGILQKVGLTAEQAAKIQPWLPAVMKLTSACYEKRKADGHPGLDDAIKIYARERGKQIIGLETAAEQLRAFSRVSLSNQGILLADSIDLSNTRNDLHEANLQLYLAQKTSWMLSTMFLLRGTFRSNERTQFETEIMSKLISERSQKWIERAQPLLETGKVLVGVGAAHLPGDKGMITLLREQGFVVTPIR